MWFYNGFGDYTFAEHGEFLFFANPKVKLKRKKHVNKDLLIIQDYAMSDIPLKNNSSLSQIIHQWDFEIFICLLSS